MWKLVIEDDEGKRTVVPLTRDDYTIGRQEGNTIRLTERNVSRSHGRIKRKRPANGNGAPAKDFFVLEDQSSYNGLFVNGIRVASTQDLAHGDLVQIGDYRIVLQDDAVSAVETAAMPITVEDTAPSPKQTVQMAASFRGQAMTERPNRMVMLVGPTPGVEYPLDRERMTIGRAEDSSISVNHNSVSRLHCEIHSLGDGRFEIVDKGSSNGVRVNGVELRRSIIEAGDVIELGDVRFKFVGAGQVFVPGPNESQQLTAISDREAELAYPARRGMGGYLLPILAAGLVGALIIVVCVYALQKRVTADPSVPTGTSSTATESPDRRPDREQALVMEAKNACTIDECEEAYRRVQTLPAASTWRSSPDFKEIVQTWADSVMKKAAAEPDVEKKKALLQRADRDPLVDDARHKRIATELATLAEDGMTPSQLPTAPTVSSANITPPPVPNSGHRDPLVPAPVASQPKPNNPCSKERIKEAATSGGRQAEVKGCLMPRLKFLSAEDLRTLKASCQSPLDPACLETVRAEETRRSTPNPY